MLTSSDEAGAVRHATAGGSPLAPGFPTAHRSADGIVTGVDVRSLPPGTEVDVETHNSHYHIVILGGSNAKIQGGPCFRDETEARIEGSALPGSFLKVGWIGVGLFMEIMAEGRLVVTSRVRSIVIDPDPAVSDSEFVSSAA